MKIMIMTMTLIWRHSILSGYTLDIITDTSLWSKTVINDQKRPKTTKNGQKWPKQPKNGQKWPKMAMRISRIHSMLPRYNLYTIPDTLQPVFRPLNTLLESKWMLTYENPCIIIQNQGEMIYRSVPKSISGSAYIICFRWFILGLIGKLFHPDFEW